MNIRNLTVPAVLTISLLFGACGEQKIEGPDGIDSQMQEGIEGIEQGAEDASGAVKDSIDGVKKALKMLAVQCKMD
jgi:hypothetical protein